MSAESVERAAPRIRRIQTNDHELRWRGVGAWVLGERLRERQEAAGNGLKN
jgi:hypothetical protein